MTKIDLDCYLKGDVLANNGKDNPVKFVVRSVKKKEPDELPYKTDKPKHEIKIENEQGTYVLTANNTTLRNCMAVWGDDDENWLDKEIWLWTVFKDVFNEDKYVIFGSPTKPEAAEKKPEKKK